MLCVDHHFVCWFRATKLESLATYRQIMPWFTSITKNSQVSDPITNYTTVLWEHVGEGGGGFWNDSRQENWRDWRNGHDRSLYCCTKSYIALIFQSQPFQNVWCFVACLCVLLDCLKTVFERLQTGTTKGVMYVSSLSLSSCRTPLPDMIWSTGSDPRSRKIKAFFYLLNCSDCYVMVLGVSSTLWTFGAFGKMFQWVY